VRGTLASATFIGDSVEYEIDLDGHMVRVKSAPFAQYAEGRGVFLRIPAERCYVLESLAAVPA
jgi:hypothetical protein